MTSASVRRLRPAGLLLAVLGLPALALLTACSPEVNAEMKTYSGINAIRVQAGLSPLVPDPALVKIARARSADMAANAYFSHTPPDGCNYVCFFDKFGTLHTYAGENIAWNTWDWTQTADIAVDMWHKSPPHLENILNCHFERFGTGVSKAADGKIYYTMIFEGDGHC